MSSNNSSLTTILSEPVGDIFPETPPEFKILEMFGELDERIVTIFLREEAKNRPYFFRFAQHGFFDFVKKNDFKPKKDVEDTKREILELSETLTLLFSFLRNDGAFSEDEEEICPELYKHINYLKQFEKFIPSLYRKADMNSKLYECIAAYAIQIASEQPEDRENDTLGVVSSKEDRNEIYRRAFRTQEQFESFHQVIIAYSVMTEDIINKSSSSFILFLESIIKDFPQIAAKFKSRYEGMKGKFKHLQNIEVSESFYREELSFFRMRAGEIYCRVN